MRVKTVMLIAASTVVLLMWALPGAVEEQQREEHKPVLVVMDVQNIWIPMMSEEDRESAPQKINESIALFREFGYPIIRVYHSDLERGPEPNTEPFEFPASIATTDDDQKIVKNYASAFTKTNLEQILRENGYDTGFLCGLSATGCVLATYFGAMEREFTVLMVVGALLSHDASYTKMIEDICYSMTIEKLRETLENLSQ